jgi:hypothetical protein
MAKSKLFRAIVALAAVVGAVAFVGALAAPGKADGVTRERLEAHGWTCVEFPPANRWSCFNPGLGRPFPGNPDPRPTYSFLGFDRTTGEFLYTGHLIREDLYNGQPCAPGNDPYVFRAAIHYYECVHA